MRGSLCDLNYKSIGLHIDECQKAERVGKWWYSHLATPRYMSLPRYCFRSVWFYSNACLLTLPYMILFSAKACREEEYWRKKRWERLLPTMRQKWVIETLPDASDNLEASLYTSWTTPSPIVRTKQTEGQQFWLKWIATDYSVPLMGVNYLHGSSKCNWNSL